MVSPPGIMHGRSWGDAQAVALGLVEHVDVGIINICCECLGDAPPARHDQADA